MSAQAFNSEGVAGDGTVGASPFESVGTVF